MRSRLLLCFLLLCVGRVAAAKTSLAVSYPFDVVWPTALRFLRIDRGWKIIEQDRDAGFLRFELVYEKRRHGATLELIPIVDKQERSTVKMQLTTSGLARYEESPILDAIERKLRDDQGPPPGPKKPKNEEPHAPAKTPPDAAAVDGPEAF